MKLEMMRGLPASGKTTYAREAVKVAGNTGRINRDDLRSMLFNSEWTGKRESVVVDVEKAIASVLFKHGMNAIIDDTNLGTKHRDMWSNFTKEQGQNFNVNDVGEGIEDCVQRDWLREKPVGLAVIHRMALQGGLIPWDDKSIVIVDIDGTLADGSHRLHLLEGDKKDWREYFALCEEDEPIDFVVRWVRELKKEFTVCLVSGRPDTTQFPTLRWLGRAGVPFNYLFMRRGGDKRPDTDVKNDILKHMPAAFIEFAIDDRPRVIREVWRANGIKVFPVRGAVEDF